MIIGHIGARKGSKGVPGKNFRDMVGKPLIDWSLDLLVHSDRIDIIIVSTDDERIYEHALTKGAFDIGLRPDELSTDSASKWNVWQHSAAKAEEAFGPITAFVDLDCTSPLRLPEDIDNALDLYFDQKPDMVMSVCDARKNPYFNLVEPDETGALHVSKPLSGNHFLEMWLHANMRLSSMNMRHRPMLFARII